MYPVRVNQVSCNLSTTFLPSSLDCYFVSLRCPSSGNWSESKRKVCIDRRFDGKIVEDRASLIVKLVTPEIVRSTFRMVEGVS